MLSMMELDSFTGPIDILCIIKIKKIKKEEFDCLIYIEV